MSYNKLAEFVLILKPPGPLADRARAIGGDDADDALMARNRIAQ